MLFWLQHVPFHWQHAAVPAARVKQQVHQEKLQQGSANTAKVIDVDLTSEEYAFGVDKTQPERLNRPTHLSRRSKMTVHWMPFVQNISVMMNLKLLNQQSLTVPKTSWL